MCEFTAHYTCKNAEINLKSTTSNGFNFWIINSLMDSWGVHLTWFDCNIYSYFNKGCRKKCMRQSRKVLWVVLSARSSKKFERMAREATDKYVWQLQSLGTVCWSYPILPFRLLHAHFWRQPFLKKLYTSLFASFLQLS